jgi:hypothetical protein
MNLDALDDLIAAAFAPVPVAFEIRRMPSWSTARRVRSCRQHDVVRNLRAAKAAGFEVREITPDGRVILGSPGQQSPEAIGMAKDAADVVAERLR